MPKVVISDTSTLILFHKIDEFNLLMTVYGATPEIADEFGEKLPNWIRFQAGSSPQRLEVTKTHKIQYGHKDTQLRASESKWQKALRG